MTGVPPMSGRVWCVRVVALIRTEAGVQSEAIYAPFYSADEASDWAVEHRHAWEPVMQISVMQLTSPSTPGEPP